ncbi:hypothetical protein CIC12_29025 [Burkholderia sp. SG-MS1]|uniref:hemerythrin domain-containing protein n=1 Tax=Paraburkholderia sp. SG-MS1 TaxID=2023741 RepID=UPI00144893E9|nr:hemerythrin domain-containing protein [Paraburkholderia sp. SG-MS1]NKJ50695.1 hypothetical protein [Paraburkholderia sp. SG-MS1]
MSSEPSAVKHIKQKHRLIQKALQLLSQASEDASSPEARPDFQVLRERLLQLKDMLRREHYATRNGIVSLLIAHRCPAMQPVLDRLRREHNQGVLLVRALIDALEVCESTGMRHGSSFDAAIKSCREIHHGRIQVEQSYVLPVAMDYLSKADWLAIDLSLSVRSYSGE